MIKLDVKDYCHSCRDFEADVEKGVRYFENDEVLMTDTVVRCEHRNRCENIKRYLEHQTSENK